MKTTKMFVQILKQSRQSKFQKILSSYWDFILVKTTRKLIKLQQELDHLLQRSIFRRWSPRPTSQVYYRYQQVKRAS